MKLGPYELDQIYTRDAREFAKLIPDVSIDLIFTDPVYDRIEDYYWLGQTAKRILTPTGSLLVFLWADDMREVLNALYPLTLEWIFSLYIPNRTKDTRCKAGFNKWTPCLWMSLEGKAKSPRVSDILQCNAFASTLYGDGTSNHEWSKSPEFFAYYIEHLTKADSIVFDPFTGGGTVPAVCKQLGKSFLACEIDDQKAEGARKRVLKETTIKRPLPLTVAQEVLEFSSC